MKTFILKVYSAFLLIAFFCSLPLFGTNSIFECDFHKLKTISSYIDSYTLQLQQSNFSDDAQEELYNALIRVRNGEVLEDAQHEVLLTLTTTLSLITTTYDDLDERAALNLANAKYYLANHDSNSKESFVLYQDSYYLYSLLAQRSGRQDIRRAADRNINKLLRTKKIRRVTQTQKTREETLMPIVAEACETPINILETMIHGLPNLLLSTLKNQGIILDDTTRENLLRKLNTHNEEILVNEREKLATKVLEDALNFNRREMEEQSLLTNSIPHIELTNTHLSSLMHLLGQTILLVHNTPLMKGKSPVLVPIGRSVSWFVKLWEKLPLHDLGMEPPPMIPILASGLRNTIPTKKQKLGYKRYLDSLGFGEYETGYEVFFLDVSETGGTLQRMQNLIEELYPGLENHTQNIALLYDGETTDLKQTRVCYMPHSLREPMFAKHNEKQYYCPFPTFYPEDWEEGLPLFSLPEGAKAFEDVMNHWINEEKYLENISLVKSLLK